jgi:hypothetical protein
MSRADTLIFFGLLVAGILLHPLYKAITGQWSWTVTVIGFVLIGLGIFYQLYSLYRNKQHARLKWQAIRLGAMIGVLLLLLLIWGNK